MPPDSSDYVCTCTDCGREVSLDDQRCPHCGGDLTETVTESPSRERPELQTACRGCGKEIRGEEYACAVVAEVMPTGLDSVCQGIQCGHCRSYYCPRCTRDKLAADPSSLHRGPARCPKCGEGFQPRAMVLSGDIDESVGRRLHKSQQALERGGIRLPFDWAGAYLGLVMFGFGLYLWNMSDIPAAGAFPSVWAGPRLYFLMLMGLGALGMLAAALPLFSRSARFLLVQVADSLALAGVLICLAPGMRNVLGYAAFAFMLWTAFTQFRKYRRATALLAGWRERPPRLP